MSGPLQSMQEKCERFTW